jgi:predicted transcriptional regulator
MPRYFHSMGTTTTERDAWFHCQVRVGLDAANVGDVISAEEVEAEAAAWRAEMRRKMSGANA